MYSESCNVEWQLPSNRVGEWSISGVYAFWHNYALLAYMMSCVSSNRDLMMPLNQVKKTLPIKYNLATLQQGWTSAVQRLDSNCWAQFSTSFPRLRSLHYSHEECKLIRLHAFNIHALHALNRHVVDFYSFDAQWNQQLEKKIFQMKNSKFKMKMLNFTKCKAIRPIWFQNVTYKPRILHCLQPTAEHSQKPLVPSQCHCIYRQMTMTWQNTSK